MGGVVKNANKQEHILFWLYSVLVWLNGRLYSSASLLLFVVIFFFCMQEKGNYFSLDEFLARYLALDLNTKGSAIKFICSRAFVGLHPALFKKYNRKLSALMLL